MPILFLSYRLLCNIIYITLSLLLIQKNSFNSKREISYRKFGKYINFLKEEKLLIISLSQTQRVLTFKYISTFFTCRFHYNCGQNVLAICILLSLLKYYYI